MRFFTLPHSATRAVSAALIMVSASAIIHGYARHPPVSSIQVHGYHTANDIYQRKAEALSIALVTVTAVGEARWDTPDGRPPPRALDTTATPIISKDVTLHVNRYLKHSLQRDRLRIREVGGTVNGITMQPLEGLR